MTTPHEQLPPGWYDLTPPVGPTLGVFPGDQPFVRTEVLDFAQGHNLRLSSITTTLHVGAHADAPSHYHQDGVAISARSPARYIGACQVVHVQVDRAARVYPHHITQPIVAPRVLLATGTFPNPDCWNSDFAALSPELIHWLADQGVQLVGLDTPSVDPETSKDLPSHAALYARDLAVLEGLCLSHVPAGLYTLVAPPLLLTGADAAPVRALLLPAGSLG
jgi:arylformamidase